MTPADGVRPAPDGGPIALGIIGGGRHAVALVDHQAPLPDVTVARWAGSPGGGDLAVVRELATRIEAPFVREWEAVARDPDLRAVIVLSEAVDATAAVEAALGAGKVVFCAAPAATRMEDVNRLAGARAGGRGILLAGGAIRHSPAGREALRLVTGGDLGPLHSLFASVRLPMTADGERASARQRAVLEEVGWDLLDFVAAAGGGEPVRVHAHVDVLFGSGAPDTAVCTIRFANDLIATLELSRCLPPAIPAPPEGEVEIEVIGGREAVRLAPGATAVRVYRAGTALRPWVDAPALSMLREVVEAARGTAPAADGLAEVRRAVGLMDAIRAAAAPSGAT